MELELLTNATVVDDAIRFVTSYVATIEKDNSDNMVTEDAGFSRSNNTTAREKL